MKGLYWNTVTPLLKSSLELLMSTTIFEPFRLVGGTSLSLQLGHRISHDIDLFTDVEYGSIDFDVISNFLHQNFTDFKTVDSDFEPICLRGKYWELIKLDFLEAMNSQQ